MSTGREQQDGDTRREYEGNYEKLKVAEPKQKCEEQGIQLSSTATANMSRKAPVRADVVAANSE
jgi:hypothetical protein